MPGQSLALADVTPVFVRAAAVVTTGTDLSTGVDLTGFEGVAQMVWTSGASAGGGAVAPSIDDSADNSVFAAVTGLTAPSLGANAVARIIFDVRNVRRYVRANSVVTGTSLAFGVALIVQKKLAP